MDARTFFKENYTKFGGYSGSTNIGHEDPDMIAMMEAYGELKADEAMKEWGVTMKDDEAYQKSLVLDRITLLERTVVFLQGELAKMKLKVEYHEHGDRNGRY